MSISLPTRARASSRELVDGLRLVAARAACRPPPGPGPVVLFLPAGPVSDGAVRLRMHEVARAIGRHGWRAAVLPWKLSLDARLAMIDRLDPDAIILQGVRHPLNRPAFYAGGAPVLLDVDDADFHLPHLAGPMADAMDHVAGVIAGSAYVARWCLDHGAPAARIVWTGTPPSSQTPLPQDTRPPVVGWAQTNPSSYAREADLVVAAMTRVTRARPDVTLRLWDRGAGEAAAETALLARLRAAGVAVDWRAPMTYAAYLASLDDVAVGLAPLAQETPFSRGKSFGKVLAYLDRGVATVASPAAEHPRFFTPATGIMAEGPEDWACAILRLLGDGPARATLARAGRAAFLERLTSDAAATRVADLLTGVLTGMGADAGSR